LQEQIRTVGKIFIGFGIFGAVASAGILVAFGGPSGLLAFDVDAKHNDLTTIPLERLIAAAYIAFSLVMAVPLVLVGRGILRWQLWAHTGGILAAAASVLLFPIGTAIGIYALWVMLVPETEPLFLNPPESRRNAPVRSL
jgi:hypothetical protein